MLVHYTWQIFSGKEGRCETSPQIIIRDFIRRSNNSCRNLSFFESILRATGRVVHHDIFGLLAERFLLCTFRSSLYPDPRKKREGLPFPLFFLPGNLPQFPVFHLPFSPPICAESCNISPPLFFLSSFLSAGYLSLCCLPPSPIYSSCNNPIPSRSEFLSLSFSISQAYVLVVFVF